MADIPFPNERNLAKVLRLRQWDRESRFNDLILRDELTGLANQGGLETGLKQKIHEVGRDKNPETGLALIKMDISYFKVFDDIFSWNEGDKCLLRLTKMLTEENRSGSFRFEDVIGRKGGDDFVIIAKIDKYGQMVKVMNKLVSIGKNLHEREGDQYKKRFKEKSIVKRSEVLKALRLPDEYTGELDWDELGIMSLTIGGVFLDKKNIALMLEKDNIKAVWTEDIEPKLDLMSTRAKNQKNNKTTAVIFNTQTLKIDKIMRAD